MKTILLIINIQILIIFLPFIVINVVIDLITGKWKYINEFDNHFEKSGYQIKKYESIKEYLKKEYIAYY